MRATGGRDSDLAHPASSSGSGCRLFRRSRSESAFRSHDRLVLLRPGLSSPSLLAWIALIAAGPCNFLVSDRWPALFIRKTNCTGLGGPWAAGRGAVGRGGLKAALVVRGTAPLQAACLGSFAYRFAHTSYNRKRAPGFREGPSLRCRAVPHGSSSASTSCPARSPRRAATTPRSS